MTNKGVILLGVKSNAMCIKLYPYTNKSPGTPRASAANQEFQDNWNCAQVCTDCWSLKKENNPNSNLQKLNQKASSSAMFKM